MLHHSVVSTQFNLWLPSRAAGVNFTRRDGVYFDIEGFVAILREALPQVPVDAIIALAEFLAGFVGLHGDRSSSKRSLEIPCSATCTSRKT